MLLVQQNLDRRELFMRWVIQYLIHSWHLWKFTNTRYRLYEIVTVDFKQMLWKLGFELPLKLFMLSLYQESYVVDMVAGVLNLIKISSATWYPLGIEIKPWTVPVISLLFNMHLFRCWSLAAHWNLVWIKCYMWSFLYLSSTNLYFDWYSSISDFLMLATGKAKN